jgi:uncharacterized protein (DUF736 family)
MAQIGKLTPTHRNGLAEFLGHIDTMDASYPVRVIGDDGLYDGQRPSHRIYSRSRAGRDVEIGQGWLKTATRGPQAGERFLSLTIDYPGFPEPLNVAAFKDRASDDWIITWRRRGGQKAE